MKIASLGLHLIVKLRKDVDVEKRYDYYPKLSEVEVFFLYCAPR
jgi:hypothetical protein